MSHDPRAGKARNVLTVSDLAQALGIGRRLAYELVGDGTIRSVRVGRAIRIPANELARFLGAELPAGAEFYSVDLPAGTPEAGIDLHHGARVWTTDPEGFEHHLTAAGVSFARADPTLILDGLDVDRIIGYRIG